MGLFDGDETWGHLTGDCVMGTITWGHFTGNCPMGTFCRGHLAGDILPGTFCRGHFAGDILPGTFCRGYFAGDILPGTFCRGHFAAGTFCLHINISTCTNGLYVASERIKSEYIKVSTATVQKDVLTCTCLFVDEYYCVIKPVII